MARKEGLAYRDGTEVQEKERTREVAGCPRRTEGSYDIAGKGLCRNEG